MTIANADCDKIVDLLVRSWVEMKTNGKNFLMQCRPPCEVVSWNYRNLPKGRAKMGRPPCEVVSWNVINIIAVLSATRSTSLWGRELKYSIRPYSRKLSGSTSLWGRELKYLIPFFQHQQALSTSLWGRELKCSHWVCIQHHQAVDLLVRSWVEIKHRRNYIRI